MDIDTLHFLDKGLTAHIREDETFPDGSISYRICITNYETEDAVWESYGLPTLDAAREEAIMVANSPLPLTF